MAACLLLGATAVPQLSAQVSVPVVEAGSDNQEEASRSVPRGNAAQGSGGNELLMSLYMQVEALQQEVQNLRGQVEEQAYQIRRMQQRQQDRYMDLDRRISNLTTGGNGQGGDAGAGIHGPAGSRSDMPVPLTQPDGGAANNSPAGRNAGVDSGAAAQAEAPSDEQGLYRSALNLLLESADYERAIQRFEQYIERFPEGRYITNAYYWLGEALILVENHAAARDAFRTVLDQYPDDPKAPGAMLKLGVAQSRMGNAEQARETWQRLIETYPDSATEARTARDYLNRMGGQ